PDSGQAGSVAAEADDFPTGRRSDRGGHRLTPRGIGRRGGCRGSRQGGSPRGGPDGAAVHCGRAGMSDQGFADRLAEIERAFEEIEAAMVEPEALTDPRKIASLGKQHADLKELVADIRTWRATITDLEEARGMSSDPDMAKLAESLAEEAEELEERIRQEIIPGDPNDEKDVILEIRSAAGGDEASIWAGDLARMFSKYAE